VFRPSLKVFDFPLDFNDYDDYDDYEYNDVKEEDYGTLQPMRV